MDSRRTRGVLSGSGKLTAGPSPADALAERGRGHAFDSDFTSRPKGRADVGGKTKGRHLGLLISPSVLSGISDSRAAAAVSPPRSFKISPARGTPAPPSPSTLPSLGLPDLRSRRQLLRAEGQRQHLASVARGARCLAIHRNDVCEEAHDTFAHGIM